MNAVRARKGAGVGAGYRAARLVFAVAFLVAGIGVAVLYWTRDRAYFAEFAREARLGEQRYHFPEGELAVPLETLLRIDGELREYVLCRCGDRLAWPMHGGLFFKPREMDHLRDVARIYAALQPLAFVAALLMLAGLFLDRRALRLVVLAEGAVVVLVGLAAALFFEPAFLLFHQALFPQGNFLFDPATDNLVLLYPEGYWLGVTLRVGAAFIVAAAVVAVLASLPIRFAGSKAGRERAVRE